MDFRKLGLALDDIGGSIRFGEAVDLIEELRNDWGSHLSAALKGWGWTASYGDVMAALTAQKLLSYFRSADSQVSLLPMPWDKPEPQVSPEERARLEALLARRSAFQN